MNGHQPARALRPSIEKAGSICTTGLSKLLQIDPAERASQKTCQFAIVHQ